MIPMPPWFHAANWSTMKNLWDGSPAKYREAIENPEPPTEAMLLGRYVHTLIFEPDRETEEYAIWSGGRRAGREWDAFRERADAEGRAVLREQDVAESRAIAGAVRTHPLVAPMLSSGVAEVRLSWPDPKTGIPCSGRADWLDRKHRLMLDLKTAATIEERRFWAQAARLGYHCQMAHYQAGVEACQGWRPSVYLVAVEKSPPYEVAVYEMTDQDLELGAQAVAETLATLRRCLEEDRWPGRYEEIRASRLPVWLFDSDDITMEGEEE